jgi:cell division protein FtsB
MGKKATKWTFLAEALPKPMRNKFIVVTVVFVLWVFFFDRNSFFDQYRLQSTLQELENKKEYYRQEILRDEKSSKDLYKNDRSREKFVREQYYMKKSNEEVFIIAQ